MPREALLKILDCVVASTPKEGLARLLRGHAALDELREGPKGARPLLKAAKLFRNASINREYYDSFEVNSKNFTQVSAGTRKWIDDLGRYMDSCVAQAKAGPADVVREAFEVLFDLVRRNDRGEDWLFFADEGGSWMFGLNCRVILSAYFKCLGATAKAKEYAKAVEVAADALVRHDKELAFGLARTAATPEQRRALDAPR